MSPPCNSAHSPARHRRKPADRWRDGVAARTVANATTPRSTIRPLRERCSGLMKAVLLMHVLPGGAGGEQQVEMKLHRRDCKGMVKSKKKVIVCD